MDNDGIFVGSSYYLPHHAPADWQRDFACMAAHGLNTVRTGELLASWDYLEKQPRQPDFRSLDTVFELAAKHGLCVLLGTGACCPPAWLAAAHPDLAIVDRDGISYPHGAMWSWACINHPAYLTEVDRFLGQLLERYGTQSVLLGWQLHNEPGFPFIPREGCATPAWYDYNAHTVAAFRNWLQVKYTDIDTLNAAWRWVPTNLRYDDFAMVAAPRASAIEWGCPHAWLDWRRFTCDNWNNFLRRQHQLIKQFADAMVTMTNIYGVALDRDGRLGIDSWSMARQCDVIGFDMYPGQRMPAAAATGRPRQGDPTYPAWFLDFAMSVARHAGKPLWLPELESGPLAGWAGGPHYVTTAADIRRWGVQALARGTRMLLFQGYREWPSLPMHWGGLADWQGEPTPRLQAAQELAKLVSKHKQLLATAQPLPANVALLYTHDNTLFNASCGHANMVEQAHTTLHATLRRLHIAVEYIPPEALASEHGYRVIIMPFQALVTAQTAQALAAFVRAGGMLVTMPRTAMVDGTCQVWPQRPGGGLTDVLGVRETTLHVQDDIALRSLLGSGHTLIGHHHVQGLQLATAVEVLGEFADGAPAITRHKYGEGVAVHIATHLDIAGTNADAQEFWRDLLATYGVQPQVRCADTSGVLDCRRAVTADGRQLLFLANQGPCELKTQMQIANMVVAQVVNLWQHGTAMKLDDKVTTACSLMIQLPAWEAMVLLLEQNSIKLATYK